MAAVGQGTGQIEGVVDQATAAEGLDFEHPQGAHPVVAHGRLDRGS